jgi:hypothetical protein
MEHKVDAMRRVVASFRTGTETGRGAMGAGSRNRAIAAE